MMTNCCSWIISHQLPLLLIYTAQLIFTSEDVCHQSFYTLPACIDQPEGYLCACGPGFYWNSRMCVSAAIDSRMSFSQYNTSIAYSVLSRKTLPPSFTMAVWLRPHSCGTIVSFKKERTKQPDYMRVALITYIGSATEHLTKLREGKTPLVLSFKLNQHSYIYQRTVYTHEWFHLTWTQEHQRNSHNGEMETIWKIFINATAAIIPMKGVSHNEETRGELILGQSSKDRNENFVLVNATSYEGDMAHFNLWNHTFTSSEGGGKNERNQVLELMNDCLLMKCGNVVQWADLRYGTRGSLQLKWPSGVIDRTCLNQAQLLKSCDRDCSRRIAVMCKAEIKENILWPRSKANNISYVACPGVHTDQKLNVTAERYCQKGTNYEGEWNYPDVSDCISEKNHNLMQESKRIQEKTYSCDTLLMKLAEFMEVMENFTTETMYNNPIDIAVLIDTLQLLPNILNGSQWRFCESNNLTVTKQRHQHMKRMFKQVCIIVNALLSSINRDGWDLTRPAGQEAVGLAQLLDHFFKQYLSFSTDLVSESQLMPSDVAENVNFENLILKIRIYTWKDFQGVSLPDKIDKNNNRIFWKKWNGGEVSVQPISDATIKELRSPPKFIACLLGIYPTLGEYLPNIAFKLDAKETTSGARKADDRVNSAIFQTILIAHNSESNAPINRPTVGSFVLKNSLNISDLHCVQLRLTPPNRRNYKRMEKGVSGPVYTTVASPWVRDGCLYKSSLRDIVCECDAIGYVAVTTDMYDPLWKASEPPNLLIALPSYVGCISSAAFCLITLLLLLYFKTSSNTASIHRNFAASIVVGQLLFLFGIDKFKHESVCHICAILLHYFFLSSFSWLMNEAFNLYIVITYAAHSHDEHTEGGMWRYYLLGWIMPGVLVAAFVGANSNDYYAHDMCWINRKHFWLFAGPGITIIAITVLVLIFTAKEHNESSYTKNEKANKAIYNQTKALWTQALLLSISWSFAFVSIVMTGIIIKWLFAMFSFLQGTFFIGFYFLLNEEVQSIHNKKHHKLFLGETFGMEDRDEEEDEVLQNDSALTHDDTADEGDKCEHEAGRDQPVVSTKSVRDHQSHESTKMGKGSSTDVQTTLLKKRLSTKNSKEAKTRRRKLTNLLPSSLTKSRHRKSDGDDTDSGYELVTSL